ncbi:hypothetical protein [Bradyrhizobium liaoningense]
MDGRDKPGHDDVEAKRPKPAGSGIEGHATSMPAIKPDFIASNVISAGFSSLCGLAKNARCT